MKSVVLPTIVCATLILTATAGQAGALPVLAVASMKPVVDAVSEVDPVIRVHTRDVRHCHGKGKRRWCHGPRKPRGSHSG